MRRWCAALLAVFLGILPLGAARADTGDPPPLTAKAAILIEASSGRVLYAKNADAVLPMASTTKIMTALVALENGDLEDTVTVSEKAHGTEGSSMYLDAGERQTLEHLLYGLMLKSGNDASVAIAEHVGGSVAGFVAMMNETAQRLGCVNTRFANPNGLPASGHETTAAELAHIAAVAMQNRTFRAIVSTRKAQVPWDGKSWDRVMANGNKLLQLYEGANGIKTGYTKAAGRCLVAGAMREDMQLISVVLSCGPMYEECAAMMDWGFANYSMEPVLEPGADYGVVSVEKGAPRTVKATALTSLRVPLRADERGQVVLELPDTLSAPVRMGDVIGRAIVRVGEDVLGEAPLLADRNARDDTLGAYLLEILRHWPLLGDL